MTTMFVVVEKSFVMEELPPEVAEDMTVNKVGTKVKVFFSKEKAMEVASKTGAEVPADSRSEKTMVSEKKPLMVFKGEAETQYGSATKWSAVFEVNSDEEGVEFGFQTEVF